MSKAVDKFLANMEEPVAGPRAPKGPVGPSKFDGMSKDRAKMLIANIIPDPQQPRKEFDEKELTDLMATIKTHGVLEPIKVRWDQKVGKWILVFGERRLRAAIMAGLTEIPCIFDEGERSRDELDEIQIIENIHRADLKPSELASWIRTYMDRVPGRTQKQIAARVRLSEATISEALAASELPPPILKLVDAGMIPIKVGAGLNKIKDEVEQARVAEKIVKENMNREDALGEVAEVKAEVNAKRPPKQRPRAAKVKLRRTAGPFKMDDNAAWTLNSKEPMTDEDVVRYYHMLGEHLGITQRNAA